MRDDTEAASQAASQRASQAAPQAAAQPASEPAPLQPHARPGKALWLVSSAFTVVVALAGYAWKGSFDLALNPPLAPTAGTGGVHSSSSGSNNGESIGGMDAAQFQQAVEGLRKRLEGEPDNVEGWAMLARSYMVLGRPDESLAAFDRATTLAPKDAGLIADHANAAAQVEGLAPGGRAAALIDKALAIDPRQPKALALAGAAAFERQDYADAVRRWEVALEVMPDHPFAPQMREGIVQAREAMSAMGGRTGAAPATSAPTAAAAAARPGAAAQAPSTSAAGAVVEGRVSLAPALAAKASPEDTVFVFARAAQGPRMPLAIVRKQVKDLPFDFKLDDSMAMSPQMKLSSFPSVVVGARVSKSGNATAQAGDLQGVTGAVESGARVDITIDSVVP